MALGRFSVKREGGNSKGHSNTERRANHVYVKEDARKLRRRDNTTLRRAALRGNYED
jgi:hypothetical protein